MKTKVSHTPTPWSITVDELQSDKSAQRFIEAYPGDTGYDETITICEMSDNV